jgi:hypothetical protein
VAVRPTAHASRPLEATENTGDTVAVNFLTPTPTQRLPFQCQLPIPSSAELRYAKPTSQTSFADRAATLSTLTAGDSRGGPAFCQRHAAAEEPEAVSTRRAVTTAADAARVAAAAVQPSRAGSGLGRSRTVNCDPSTTVTSRKPV